MHDDIEIIRMPKLGMSMTAGKVEDWHYAEGDPINAGDEVVEVSTEKITHGICCETSGVLRRILVASDDSVNVETPLAVIAKADVNDDLIDQALNL